MKGTEGTLAWKRKASRPVVSVPSWIDTNLLAFLSILLSFRISVPRVASDRSGLGGLIADHCYCCHQRVVMLHISFVDMVAGHLMSF